MPNIVTLTLAQAEEVLRQAGHERGAPGVEAYLCHNALDDGTVIEKGRICHQQPGAGNPFGSKLPVIVRVQTKNPYEGDQHKKPWVFMPDLVGKTVAQARDALKTAGVTGEAKLVGKPGCKADTVCETFPAAEERTGVASEKLLYVGN